MLDVEVLLNLLSMIGKLTFIEKYKAKSNLNSSLMVLKILQENISNGIKFFSIVMMKIYFMVSIYKFGKKLNYP
jgi:hypothetical protein